jgi:hypothetical protein
MPAEAALHPGLSAEDRIEVAALPAGHGGEQLGVEVIGPHFEGLESFPPLAGYGGEAEAE